MENDSPFVLWRRLNEKKCIDEMLLSRHSEYWSLCSNFVYYYLEKRFTNLLPQLKEEVVQDTVLSIYKSLPAFRHESQLTTWIVSIAYHRAIDIVRRQFDGWRVEASIDDFQEPSDCDSSHLRLPLFRTPEEEVLAREEV